MSTIRRKILFNLNPENNPADRYVCECLARIAQGDRGRMNRAALLSGFALQRIDPRLPHILAELLTSNTTVDEILQVIRAVLPSEKSREISQSSGKTEPDEPAGDITRKNALNIFGQK
ncbi:plasmid partitioning/stability family protein [Mixta intestinalis]|uniref:Plasmid stability protein StbB n=1 Tax=Mixta intestinalis TaxID=1615494 RepID=A0A6P1Q6M7_9GAMM|nr:plasmid partitioning/stability family protein [Mixta intestinalis]QHM74052.1 hypothetical protein C7M51_04413 [Mixta intestinalis]